MWMSTQAVAHSAVPNSLYKGVCRRRLPRKNPKSTAFLSFARSPRGRQRRNPRKRAVLPLFCRDLVTAFPPIVGALDESEVAFDEHLFNHLKPWIFVQQLDQRPRAL